MTTKLNQTMVDRAMKEHAPGKQLYDSEVKGLRLVVGKRSCSYKLVGYLNNGSSTYVSLLIGRTDEISVKKARELSVAAKIKMRQGIDPRVPKTQIPTLSQALDRYLENRPDLSAETALWYTQKSRNCLRPLLKLPLDRLSRDACRRLHEGLTKKIGPYGANGALRVLRLLYNDTARDHDLPPNPVSLAVRFNKETARDWAVPPQEMPLLWSRLDAMQDPLRRACWMTMLLTGLRSKDARSMRWENLDGDGVLTVPSPKGGEERAFKLPLCRLLLQELEAVREFGLGSQFVFPSASSQSGHLEQVRRNAGFPYSPHQMRHGARSYALEAGIDLQMVLMMLNHKPAGVTWGYITRSVLLGPMREASERLCETLVSYRGRNALQ